MIDIKQIEEKERQENKSFASWINSPIFKLDSHLNKALDLEIYMISKNREIADLECEIMRLKNNTAKNN